MALPPTRLEGQSWKVSSIKQIKEFSQTLLHMHLSKTAHNSGCSGSCSLTSVGYSPALSNVLHGAFHSNKKKA